MTFYRYFYVNVEGISSDKGFAYAKIPFNLYLLSLVTHKNNTDEFYWGVVKVVVVKKIVITKFFKSICFVDLPKIWNGHVGLDAEYFQLDVEFVNQILLNFQHKSHFKINLI